MKYALFLLFGCTACTPLHLFQSKVPEPVTPSADQIESQRSAADLIARKIQTPVELIPVAASLSASLGTPRKSLVDVKAFSLPTAATQANTDLQSGIRDMQDQLHSLNVKLTKLQGKDIEGTGFSILGPGMAMVVIGLIVLGVVFPPAFTLLFMAFKRLRSTTGKIVSAIDSVSDEHETSPAITTLKSTLSNVMDRVEKQVVHAFQKP